MIVFLVGRVEDDLQKFLVAMNTADVFGWASPCAVEADGSFDDFVHRDDLLQNDLVPPIVTKIV